MKKIISFLTIFFLLSSLALAVTVTTPKTDYTSPTSFTISVSACTGTSILQIINAETPARMIGVEQGEGAWSTKYNTLSDSSTGKYSLVTNCGDGTTTTTNFCVDSPGCITASCSDGVKNQDETGVDCGGSKCNACKKGTGASCTANNQCTSNICTGGKCATTPPKKANGLACTLDSECISTHCDSKTNKCAAPPDLGDSGKSANGAACTLDSQCASNFCHPTTKLCANKIAVGSTCSADSQCTTGVCTSTKCVNKLANGGACSRAIECTSNICTGNKCVAPPAASTGTPSTGGGGSRCKSNYQYNAWSYCNSTLQQARTGTDFKCRGNPVKYEVRSCTACQYSWVCESWTNSDQQCGSRKCFDEHDCKTTIGKPSESKTCPPVSVKKQPYIQKPAAPSKPFIPPVVTEKVKSLDLEGLWEEYSVWVLGGAGGLVLLIIIIVLIVHFVHKNKVTYNFEELEEWIIKERRMGTADVDIRQILQDQTGWTHDEISKAFQDLGGHPDEVTAGPPIENLQSPPVA